MSEKRIPVRQYCGGEGSSDLWFRPSGGRPYHFRVHPDIAAEIKSAAVRDQLSTSKWLSHAMHWSTRYLKDCRAGAHGPQAAEQLDIFLDQFDFRECLARVLAEIYLYFGSRKSLN